MAAHASRTILAGLLASGTWATTATADDKKRLQYGQHLARECTTCHRLDGIDNGIPSIVGMKPEAFLGAFAAYRSGTRDNPAMVSVAESLDAEQMEALAAFYASLPPPPK